MSDDLIDEPQTPDTPAPDTPGQDAPAAPPPKDTHADMLSAVSAAIDAETPADVRDAADAAGAATTATGETPPADDGKPALERDEHGRFKPRAGDAATSATPAKPTEAAKPDAAAKPNGKDAAAPPTAKPADPVNDPIPPEIRGKTRERMETLVKSAKELTVARDQAIGERDEILGMIQQTRATPEQYGQMLEYMSAVNSGDPAQIRKAIATVQGELAALSRLIGEPVPGVDLLSEHHDLRTEVENGDLSLARAQELAAARGMRAVQARAGEQTAAVTELDRAIQGGRNSLNALEVQLRQSDPAYDAKRAVLIEVLQPVLQNLPPAQWAQAFRSAYERLPASAIAPPAPPPPPPTLTQNQPLRARQPAGQGARAPGSMLEALNNAIDGR